MALLLRFATLEGTRPLRTGQIHVRAVLLLEKQTGTHWIARWVTCSAALVRIASRNILALTKNQISVHVPLIRQFSGKNEYTIKL
jgi:hypothetical protein